MVEEEMETHVCDDKPQKKQHSLVLDCFNGLVKDKQKIRVQSGSLLAKHLVQNAETEIGVNEAKYSLARLIRGLGGTQNNSKLGFYTALAALLQIGKYTIDEVFEVADKQLKTSSKNSKSENADILTGHVLLCGALLRSGQFTKTSEEHRTKIMEMLINATNKRSYLSLLGYKFIVDSLGNLEMGQFEKSVLVRVQQEILKPLSEFNLDQLYFLLAAHDRFPDAVDEEFLLSTIQTEEILCEENIRPIARILMGVLPIKQVLSHPVYQIACEKIAASEYVSIFVGEIDEYLKKPTQMSHHAATLLLYLLVDNLRDKSLLPEILTGNFLKTTLQHFQNVVGRDEDDLQLNIYSLFDLVVSALKTEGSDVKLGVLKRMLFHPGTFTFEKATKSKVVQQITAGLDAEGVFKLAKIYVDVVDEQDGINTHRIYAANLLGKLLSHPAVKHETDWKLERLKSMMGLGLMKNKDCNIRMELAVGLKDTFFRLLGSKWPKLEDLRNVLSHLMHYLDGKMTQKNYASVMRYPFNHEDFNLWKRTVAIVDKLEKQTKKSHLNPVFHTLFLQMGLQLLNDVRLARDSLHELFACYEKGSGKNNDEEFNWIEVVVDLFMNLLSHKSHLLRSVIGCVFPYLCKDLTPTAIQQILSVVDPKTDSNPLTENVDSDDDDDDDDEDDDDDDDGDDDDENERSDEEEENDEVVLEEEEEYKETINDKLRQAVQAALGDDMAQTDTESVDMDQMSDGECDKLNSALGQAFKLFARRKSGKKNKRQTKEDEQLTHFRIRVLDLIEMYLDSADVSMIISLEIMLPLLQSLEFSISDPHQKPLQDRVKYCLKKLTNLKTFATMADVKEETLCNLLAGLLEKGSKNVLMLQELSEKTSDCCLFLVRCAQLLKNSESKPKKKSKTIDGIYQVLGEALQKYFVSREYPTGYILMKSMLATTSWPENVRLVPHLIKYAFGDEVRNFKRNHALELLRIFYSNQRSLSSNLEQYRKTLIDCEKQLGSKCVHLFERPQSDVKEKFVGTLFALLAGVKNSPVKTEAIDWVEISKKICEYRSTINFNRDSKSAFNKLCGALKISNVVHMKPKLIKLSSGNDDETCSEKSKKKKGKSSNERKKLKKITKMLRAQNMSEGFEDSPFGNTDLGHLKAVEAKMIAEEESRKRKADDEVEESSDDSELQTNGNIASDDEIELSDDNEAENSENNESVDDEAESSDDNGSDSEMSEEEIRVPSTKKNNVKNSKPPKKKFKNV